MDELEKLKSMWSPKVKRSTDLIVNSINYESNEGSFNNKHWAFNVPYCFRDALDMKYEQRTKSGKPYMVWTQGPIIKFDQGDIVKTYDEKVALQVKYSNIMDWDSVKNQMYEGSVTFDKFCMHDSSFKLEKTKTVSQMNFLKLLIGG